MLVIFKKCPHPIILPAFLGLLFGLAIDCVSTFLPQWTNDGLGIAPYEGNYLTSETWALWTFIMMAASIGVGILLLAFSLIFVFHLERRGFTYLNRVFFIVLMIFTFFNGLIILGAFVLFDEGICCHLKGHGKLTFGISIYLNWGAAACYLLSSVILLLFVSKFYHPYLPNHFVDKNNTWM
ncbi:hypothetical protein GCK72_021357 [Caenorhabditis remanei]|uniref:Uncharacterized protein n=1 Tax=Caenorhabditis remanei TaxID=31234 RepID=A0A6A5GJC1_CAERE|nr:hypothetical protein GCK72_021357 [Caenorhabditis remanei]KAF1754793.1 hypothetical protein GCK72_021357 [Caenorhabditis remanei]